MTIVHEIEEFFGARYESTPRYWWDVPHAYSVSPDDHGASLMAQQVLRHAIARGPGRAIDLGSGEGADAIRLARLGWDVEAVELTAPGARKIRQFAAENGVQVTVHQADIVDFEPDGLFDLVMCHGVLHYVPDKLTACRKMQRMTRPGGVNAVSLWSDFSPVPTVHQVVPTYPDAEQGVVVSAYADWPKSLLYFERNRPEVGHSDTPPHVHSHIKMIARKV
ncbi:class I SAM-dependent methyltransferase [Plantactinospora sp. WMMB334]|uniref:class I SAM-dependent methyltransferase n=1 Tax=Plantactinospora sp. WMMB334 TaxID=3404119 RepID=UPI003B96131B